MKTYTFKLEMSCDILTLWYERVGGGGITSSLSPKKSLRPYVQ